MPVRNGPIEKLLFASRWILLPVYLGSSLALVALGVKLFIGLYRLTMQVVPMSEADLVLRWLALVDVDRGSEMGLLDRIAARSHAQGGRKGET